MIFYDFDSGHKLYAVKRRREFVENVRTMLEHDYNYERFKVKINGYILNDNLDSLARHLLLRPNTIFSMISKNFDRTFPYLFTVCQSSSFKLFELFFASLNHYASKLVSWIGAITFGKKYMNFRLHEVIYETVFVKYIFFSLTTAICNIF